MINWLFSVSAFVWIAILAGLVLASIVSLYRDAIDQPKTLALITVPLLVIGAITFWLLSRYRPAAKIEILLHGGFIALLIGSIPHVALAWWKDVTKGPEHWSAYALGPIFLAVLMMLAINTVTGLQEFLAAEY